METVVAGNLRERVVATGLVVAHEPLVVMLSGGRDSVCLLAIAVELECGVRALHIDYHLRGAESEAEAEHCRELALHFGVELRQIRAPSAPAGNTHAWAREFRYAQAQAFAAGDTIAVAHTATDQLETVLYRLATSPGRRALLGMPHARGDIVRPLLAAAVTRDQTAAFCRARGVAWREDSANADRGFARTRVREELLPALLAVDPRAHDNVLRTAALLRDEAEVLDAVVAATLKGRDHVALATLAALPAALGRLVLRQLAEDATGRSGARAAARLDDVLELGDGMLDLGDGARVAIEQGRVRVVRHSI